MENRQPHGSFLKAAFKFRQRNHGKDETLDDYLTALRTLAVDFNFGETLVERLQLVNGCAEMGIQQELLALYDLTLGRVFAGSPNKWQRQPRKRRSLT